MTVRREITQPRTSCEAPLPCAGNAHSAQASVHDLHKTSEEVRVNGRVIVTEAIFSRAG